MYQNIAVICKPVVSKQTCMHYWVIKSANGPVSRGMCRFCGIEREFSNYPTECGIQQSTFRELPGGLDQGEPDWDSFIEVEYKDETAAGGQGGDGYDQEVDVVCAAA